MRAHRSISQSWSSKSNGTHSPQKDVILTYTTFTTKLVLKTFDEPTIVQCYKRLTATCKAFHIGLVPFNAIQFWQPHEGLGLPGLGVEKYVNIANALCTVMTTCLENSDNWVKVMVTSVETKSRTGYKIIWCLFCRYIPGFDPAWTVDKLSWDDFDGNIM